MRVIVKRPGRQATVENIDNTMEALPGILGGYIRVISVATDCVMICHEEGRLLGLPRNNRTAGVDFHGTVIVAGVSGDDFTDCPMSLEDFERDWLYWLGEEETV